MLSGLDLMARGIGIQYGWLGVESGARFFLNNRAAIEGGGPVLVSKCSDDDDKVVGNDDPGV